MPKTDTPSSKPAKAAPRKATARPRRPTAKAPAAPAAQGETPDQPVPTITFRGRTMPVVQPVIEQLDVWNRTVDRLRDLQEAISAARTAEEKAAADEALERSGMKLVSRLSRIIQSVLPDEADHDWLDEQFLRRQFTYLQAADIISLALDALGVPHTLAGQARPAARLRA